MTASMNLHNKKVIINTTKILKNSCFTNNHFINFIKANKNCVLTAIADSKVPYLYTFKEDDSWLFDECHLIKVD